MIRVAIVDDEPPARRAIRARLTGESDVEIVGEAEDGPEAITVLGRMRPDLVFLDVQMPGLDGFQVLERLPEDALPLVVFVTAHDVHAVRAFEIHALDYLLKPFSEERFRDCLAHARSALALGQGGDERLRVREMLARRPGTGPDRPRRFAVRARNRVVFVRVEDLRAVEAAENYVTLVTDEDRHLLRLTMVEMEQQLDPARFARIHRSTIVPLDRIREVRLDSHGDGEVVMEDGATYRMSRAYRDRVVPGRPVAGDSG